MGEYEGQYPTHFSCKTGTEAEKVLGGDDIIA